MLVALPAEVPASSKVDSSLVVALEPDSEVLGYVLLVVVFVFLQLAIDTVAVDSVVFVFSQQQVVTAFASGIAFVESRIHALVDFVLA